MFIKIEIKNKLNAIESSLLGIGYVIPYIGDDVSRSPMTGIFLLFENSKIGVQLSDGLTKNKQSGKWKTDLNDFKNINDFQYINNLLNSDFQSLFKKVFSYVKYKSFKSKNLKNKKELPVDKKDANLNLSILKLVNNFLELNKTSIYLIKQFW